MTIFISNYSETSAILVDSSDYEWCELFVNSDQFETMKVNGFECGVVNFDGVKYWVEVLK